MGIWTNGNRGVFMVYSVSAVNEYENSIEPSGLCLGAFTSFTQAKDVVDGWVKGIADEWQRMRAGDHTEGLPRLYRIYHYPMCTGLDKGQELIYSVVYQWRAGWTKVDYIFHTANPDQDRSEEDKEIDRVLNRALNGDPMTLDLVRDVLTGVR